MKEFDSTSLRKLEAHWLGRVAYEQGLEAQKSWCEAISSQPGAHVLGLEHEPVVSLGVRGSLERDVPLGIEALKSQGVELYRVRRGGEATLHAPGQLVIYPLLPLRNWGLGVREFVEGLQEVTKTTLKGFGVESWVQEGEPGLYTSQGKIAFFGIRVDRGVSTHGLSINVSNDLELFELIRSCGRDNQPHDSLSRYAQAGLVQLFSVWVTDFAKAFQLDPKNQIL